MDVLDGLRRGALVELVAVERLNLGGTKVLELGGTERRVHVQAHEDFVGLVGVGANAAPHGVLEPPWEVLL